jgi:SdpI/YfhL protein family
MEAIGPVLIALSIPLILRWVPPNLLYGFRIAATLDEKSVWYDANALFGRHMLLLGVLMVGLDFLLPASMRTVILAPIGWIGVLGIIIIDWRTANRWRRDRQARP